MNSIHLALEGAGRVLFAGLLFGAGLPVVYAMALRALTLGAPTVDGDGGPSAWRPRPLGRLLAAVLVAVVIAGVALGLVLIVASGIGTEISFEGILPTIVDKN